VLREDTDRRGWKRKELKSDFQPDKGKLYSIVKLVGQRHYQGALTGAGLNRAG
jgi:hypothetical protein